MAHKLTHLQKLPDALDEMLAQFARASFEKRQEAVQAGAETFLHAVEAVTPRDTGEMARSWRIKTRYTDRRYVGNTRVAHGKVYRRRKDGSRAAARKDVPLSNVLEYAENSPHRGFIRRCFDDNEQSIYEAIRQKLL